LDFELESQKSPDKNNETKEKKEIVSTKSISPKKPMSAKKTSLLKVIG